MYRMSRLSRRRRHRRCSTASIGRRCDADPRTDRGQDRERQTVLHACVLEEETRPFKRRPDRSRRALCHLAKDGVMSDRKPLILVVEDDPSVQNLLRILLEAEGYEVIHAEDGLEGLVKMELQHPSL